MEGSGMKKGQVMYVVIGIIVIASGCNGSKTRELESRPISNAIDLIKAIESPIEQFLLSDEVESLEIVPLETTKQSVFRKCDNLQITDNEIFINSARTIMRFDRASGKYLGTIGKRGQGPNEYIWCTGIGVNEQEDKIFLFTSHNRLISYNLSDGKGVETSIIAETDAHTAGTNSERGYTYIAGMHMINRPLPLIDRTEDYWLCRFYDDKGTILSTFYNPFYIGREAEFNAKKILQGGYSLTENVWDYYSAPSPIVIEYDSVFSMLFYMNDTIYSCDPHLELMAPRYILNCGKRPDFALAHQMVKEKEFFDYIDVSDIFENGQNFFLQVEKEEKKYLVRFDKETGECSSIVIQTPLVSGKLGNNTAYRRKYDFPSFENDISGGLPFYPKYVVGKSWVAIYGPDELLEVDLDALKSRQVKDPAKRDQLVRVIENVKDDDNPVLMIVAIR